jgi:peptidoglycan/xylan/chitin deacetylase (PgdA/CDA1 family)
VKIPVLTYHAMRIHGRDYGNNDLVALAADLEAAAARGFRILPLARIVSAWLEDPEAWTGQRVVAFTCDDGSDFDFTDLEHPSAGPQRGVLNILRDFRARRPHDGAHVTSFVIASPEIRTYLDKTCMIGRGWWNDGWWREAAATGLMDIANHSWDHNHETLPEPLAEGVPRGTFRNIATAPLADFEIRVAQDFLRQRVPNAGNALFAYPYGDTNPFLVEDYLPREGASMGLKAAVSAEPEYFTSDADRWAIPRFICGRDWKDPAGFAAILEGSA